MAHYLLPFGKLDVWKMSADLAAMGLNTIEKAAQGGHMRLTRQMGATVTSPLRNIAEGKGRQYKKAFIRFLHIAQGSVYEVVTLKEIFRRRKLFSDEESIEVRTRCEQFEREPGGLINSLKGKSHNRVFEGGN